MLVRREGFVPSDFDLSESNAAVADGFDRSFFGGESGGGRDEKRCRRLPHEEFLLTSQQGSY